jgi:SAM-dependent methyltransferase
VETSGAEGTGAEWAERAYEAMAPVYDDFTAHHDYEGWLGDLLTALERRGLTGQRLLDVACGTGKSFMPMLPLGWQVTACDISPAMLDLAREKTGDAVSLAVADMLELPTFGAFDLVWALDDAVNYLLSPEELERALVGMRDNLAPTGLLLFDVNELLGYRTFGAGTTVVERGGNRLIWRGQGTPSMAPGSIWESSLEIVPSDESPNAGSPETAVHRQRHFAEAEVLAALERAGLECLEVYGQSTDGVLKQPLDVESHTKAVYIARRAGNKSR